MRINNIVFSLLLIIGYILLAFLIELPALLIIQLILIVIAISPIGEGIQRFIYGARPIKTNKDKEKLFPLFMEVYDTIREKKTYTNRHIKLHIDRSMNMNAYAIGRNTIAITKGAMMGLTDNQIKGLLAHEFRSFNTWRLFALCSVNCRKCILLTCNVYHKNI